jgi:hypothetical protein
VEEVSCQEDPSWEGEGGEGREKGGEGREVKGGNEEPRAGTYAVQFIGPQQKWLIKHKNVQDFHSFAEKIMTLMINTNDRKEMSSGKFFLAFSAPLEFISDCNAFFIPCGRSYPRNRIFKPVLFPRIKFLLDLLFSRNTKWVF